MNRSSMFLKMSYLRAPATLVLAGMLAVGLACNGVSTGGTAAANAGDDGGAGGPSDGTADSNTLVTEALGFEGFLSGNLATMQSTRSAGETDPAAQVLPPEFDAENAIVRFKDLGGNDLHDADGNPVDEVSVAADGSFSADGLPVGTDFVVCGDIGDDGDCDVESFVHIPSTDGGSHGRLDGVRADPLTTMVLAKLKRLIAERGIDFENLPVSPAVVVARIVEAFINLFEEFGIDQTLTLADLVAESGAELADRFDSIVPREVRIGMEIVEGNLKLAEAEDVQALALGVAEVFLRAGFPVADLPGPPDFGALADLEGITLMSRDELFPQNDPFKDLEESPDALADRLAERHPEEFPDGIPEDEIDDFLIGLPPDQLDGQPIDDRLALAEFEDDDDLHEVFYVSTTVEPDRNFGGAGDMDKGDGPDGPHLPVLTDHVLMEFARLHLSDRRITLGTLHELLSSLEHGLGVRLVHSLMMPHFVGPPLTVFETADGNGLAIDLDRFFRRLFVRDLDGVDGESFDRREVELRQVLNEHLGGTVPPPFERLFGGILSDRLGSFDELADRIRHARVHLPFNRTGPSTFFVVAVRPDTPSTEPLPPATVDADISIDGEVHSIAFNPSGDGAFLLGFTERTDRDGIVELLWRESGRLVHGPRAPVRVSVFDDSIFEPVDGVPFRELVSESGVFFPGTHISIVRDDFVPDDRDPAETGPNERLFVLAMGFGDDARPVRVDFDPFTGSAHFNPEGRHLLMFLEDTFETGLFALFNEHTGRPAGAADPVDFFDAPLEKPEGFEDIFNETDDFSIFDDLSGVDQFVDDVFGAPDEGDMTTHGVEPVLVDGDTGLVPDPELTPVTDDGTTVNADAINPASVSEHGFIIVAASDIVGLPIVRERFVHVFGTEVPNGRYDPAADPYYDDLNANNAHDADEPTAPFRPMLFDPRDWRSTDIRLYYRRADNGLSVAFDEVDFEADTPLTLDGVALVPRTYRARLNAFRFGRPNTAINLLTAFAPPDFFDGTHGLTRDTKVDVLSAVAIMNLVMDQVFNLETEIDIDGLGPLPRKRLLVDAHLFVVPIDDPFVLLIKGFRERAIDGRPASAP